MVFFVYTHVTRYLKPGDGLYLQAPSASTRITAQNHVGKGEALEMGTPSLIYFQQLGYHQNEVCAVIFQQNEGYLAGVGRVLASFLKKVRLVNGFTICPAPNYNEGEIICNGFGDVVAQFIQRHKEMKPVPFQSPPSPFYIYPAVEGQEEEFTYYVTAYGNNITIRVNNYEAKSEEMTIEEFYQLCNA